MVSKTDWIELLLADKGYMRGTRVYIHNYNVLAKHDLSTLLSMAENRGFDITDTTEADK